MLIVFLVFMCGQFSGFAVIVNYTVDIFNAADTGIDSNTSTIIVGIIRWGTAKECIFYLHIYISKFYLTKIFMLIQI